MRDEYDFTVDELRSGVRGKYARRDAEGATSMPVDPHASDVSPIAGSGDQSPSDAGSKRVENDPT